MILFERGYREGIISSRRLLSVSRATLIWIFKSAVLGARTFTDSYGLILSPNRSNYVEVSYTRAPERVKLLKDQPGDAHVSYLEVARLSTHAAREEVLAQDPHPYPSEGPLAVSLPPDEHLMVVDFAYFMGQLTPWEWEEQYFAPWRVAAHCHWNNRMTELAGDYLARLFQVPSRADVPKVGITCFEVCFPWRLSNTFALSVHCHPRTPR